MRIVPFIVAALALLAAACFERIYKDRRYCDTSADCTDPSFGSFCDRGVCQKSPPDGFDFDGDLPATPCAASTECPIPSRPICDPQDGVCRGCAPATTGPSAECAAHPGRPICAASGACVECLTRRDCLTARKACDTATGTCVACTANEACASGLCESGVCADPKDLVYVDAKGPGCPGGGTGTFDDPFCTLQAGLLDEAAKGGVVIVFSGTYRENVVVQPTAAFNVRVVGVGQPVLAPSAPGPAFQVSYMAQPVNLTLDGLVVEQASGNAGHGIHCDGSTSNPSRTKVRILRSTVRDNAQIGIKSSGCDLTVDQAIIGPDNKQGGIAIVDSDFTVMNAVVQGNGTEGPSGSSVGGVHVSGSFTTAKIINAVFVGNKAREGAFIAGGLHCVGTPTVFNVVLRDNLPSSLEITSAECKPDHSAYVGAMTGGGSNNLDLMTCPSASLFVNPSAADYHPRAGGAAPCNLVNAGTGAFMAASAPAYDLEGTARPKQGAFDIGAYEAP